MSGWRSEFERKMLDELAGTDSLIAPLVYYSDLLGCEIVVPVGFVTDYASVPRLPLVYLVVGGKGQRAAVVHDWLYSGGLVNGRALTRKECDQVFAEALVASGYGRLVKTLMYTGVRIGGASHFTKPNVPQTPEVLQLMEPALA